jgi:ATP-dependent helicase/nuclease subunit A
MKKPHVIPESMENAQRLAANPGLSAWVSANAGSGKTHVLSRRVIRLLLDGTDPSRILCLTYTRAAAAEMSNRVFRDLGRWAMMDDAELEQEILKLDGVRPSQEILSRARRLFARALETPGGLKIQTIHAFCEAVLHQFPLEANIAGRFELADQAVTDALLTEARRQILTAASVRRDGPLAVALQTVLAWGGEAGLENLLGEIISKRDALRAFTAQFEGGGPGEALRREFLFESGTTEAVVAARVWPLPCLDEEYARSLLDHARSAKAKTAETFAEGLLEAAAESDPGVRLRTLQKLFLKQDGDPKGTGNLAAAKVVDAFPDIAGRFEEAASHVISILDRRALLRMIDATESAMILADALIERYQHLKVSRGLLDFNDLITRTVQLLSRRDAGPWVQYKLDKGIDHILVDEAQDTSPAQWAVIRMLAGEFFAGEGSRGDQTRTIFAVGDEKQSIYSFQGAEPEAFSLSRYEFSEGARNAGKRFEPVGLKHSFRSVADVLSAVDLVFSDTESRRGLTLYDEDIAHVAIRESEPGFVELWDSIGEQATEEPEDWRREVDHATAASVQLANAIAGKIECWLKGTEHPNGARSVRPGEIIVLVRKRDPFMHALSRALKSRHIPVAGADRIRLRDHIAVKDMMALGRIVLNSDDDLSLAALMKSPVFGLNDDVLMAIAIGRPANRTLFETVRQNSDFCFVAERIDIWRTLAVRLPVFDFYARLLGEENIRRDMIARLGNEAGDILDEFLNFALSCEKAGISGLEAFLAMLETKGPEVRRESDSSRDEVRIMTVHAAKGLEGRFVFLVDSGGEPASDSHLPRLLPLPSEYGLWREAGFLWYPAKELQNKVSRSVRAGLSAKAEDEYRRLLYVGMTRAEDGLIICGYHGKRDRHPGTWHAMAARALAGKSEKFEDPLTGLNFFRYRITPDANVPVAEKASEGPRELPALPEYLVHAIDPPPRLPRPLSPSGVSAVIEAGTEFQALTTSPVFAADANPTEAMLRGTAIHRLLQELPEMPEDRRNKAALNFLAHAMPDLGDGQRAKIIESVFSVLDNPEFAIVFGAASRAEVAVMGTVSIGGTERAVSGKIDRIAVVEDEVVIVDYKTNRPPPLTLRDIPDTYVAQMALYRALISPLYPGRSVRTGLLFTESTRLFELPQAKMDAALARLNAP